MEITEAQAKDFLAAHDWKQREGFFLEITHGYDEGVYYFGKTLEDALEGWYRRCMFWYNDMHDLIAEDLWDAFETAQDFAEIDYEDWAALASNGKEDPDE